MIRVISRHLSIGRAGAAILLLILAGAPPSAAGQLPPYTFDIPRLFPKAYATWQASLPYAVTLPAWLVRFDGVATPIRDVSVDGRPMKFGTVCMPHDCGANMAGILFSPDGARVTAVVRLFGRNQTPTIMIVGRVSGHEYACIRDLTDNSQLTKC